MYAKSGGTAAQVKAFINTTPTIGGVAILGVNNGTYITLAAFTYGRLVERNLLISSSTDTVFPSFTNNIANEYNISGVQSSNSTGGTDNFQYQNIDWTTTQYLVMAGNYQSTLRS